MDHRTFAGIFKILRTDAQSVPVRQQEYVTLAEFILIHFIFNIVISINFSFNNIQQLFVLHNQRNKINKHHSVFYYTYIQMYI